MRLRIVLLGLAVAAGSAVAAEPAKPDVMAKGPLAELPGRAGPHLEKIKTLPDNSWLELGVPAANDQSAPIVPRHL
jgi:hypothetical protein